MVDIMAQKNFIEKMWPIADDEFKRSNIFPHVTITQSAHESDWGLSFLTVKANNLFGFTGELWEKQGKPVLTLPTREFVNGKWITVNRPFRAYESWAASVRDWASLMQRSRYVDAVAFAKTGDVPNFAKAVAAAGYATDPTYASKLAQLYEGITNLLPPIEG